MDASISKGCCPPGIDIISFVLRVREDIKVQIPNIFTPDGDGLNDGFTAFVKDGQARRITQMKIFNRWGNLIFEQERFGNTQHWGSYEAWWDGTSMHDMQLGKEKLPSATYFYILYFNKDGKEPITGHVFLND